QGHDNHDLIDVGDENVLAAARGAGEQSMAGLDALDQPLIIEGRSKPDPVAGGDDVSFIGYETAQQPANGTAILPAVFHLDHAVETVDAEHAPGQTVLLVGSRHPGRFLSAGRGPAAVLLNDGALARQLALGADALLPCRGLLFIAVIMELPCP